MKQRLCSNCQQPLDSDSVFCMFCGQPVSSEGSPVREDVFRCPQCNEVIGQYDKFCEFCGYQLPQSEQSAGLKGSVPVIEESLTEPIDIESTNGKKCPKCGTLNEEEDMFCVNCGYRFSSPETEPAEEAAEAEPQPEPVPDPEPEGKVCPQCGTKCEEEDMFCVNCGYRFSSPETEPAEEVPASEAENAKVDEERPVISEESEVSDNECAADVDPEISEAKTESVIPEAEDERTTPPEEDHEAVSFNTCRNCGSKFDLMFRFCPFCGTPAGTRNEDLKLKEPVTDDPEIGDELTGSPVSEEVQGAEGSVEEAVTAYEEAVFEPVEKETETEVPENINNIENASEESMTATAEEPGEQAEAGAGSDTDEVKEKEKVFEEQENASDEEAVAVIDEMNGAVLPEEMQDTLEPAEETVAPEVEEEPETAGSEVLTAEQEIRDVLDEPLGEVTEEETETVRDLAGSEVSDTEQPLKAEDLPDGSMTDPAEEASEDIEGACAAEAVAGSQKEGAGIPEDIQQEADTAEEPDMSAEEAAEPTEKADGSDAGEMKNEVNSDEIEKTVYRPSFEYPKEIYCLFCGRMIPSYSVFCLFCGSDLRRAPEQAETADEKETDTADEMPVETSAVTEETEGTPAETEEIIEPAAAAAEPEAAAEEKAAADIPETPAEQTEEPENEKASDGEEAESEPVIPAPSAEGYKCPNCGKMNIGSAMFCRSCGSRRVEDTRSARIICVNCGKELTSEDVFCSNCGTQVKKIALMLESNKYFCIQCGAELADNESFCPKCGTKADRDGVPAETRRKCRKCGNILYEGEVFCTECGYKNQ